MRRLIFVTTALVSAAALGQVRTLGDLVLVPDTTGSIHNSMFLQSTFCADAYNQARTVLPDLYDGVITFSALDGFNEIQNTWQGTPVRTAATGIGRGPTAGATLTNPFATYNSTKLSQCVFMGTAATTAGFIPGLPGAEPLPPNPDAITYFIGGTIPHLTGIEMLGHEYGHHWLVALEYDKNDGAGKRTLLRGCEGSGGGCAGPQDANQHYSATVDSRSVMYGSYVTDLGGGQFQLAGGVRKYNELDQYLMGLRAPSEVSPLMLVDDGSGGDPSQPLTRGATAMRSGTRVDVSIDDVVRAMGPRVPAYGAGAQSCFRAAFIIVMPQGMTTPPTAVLQKVDAYRRRWAPWFNDATDGRGVMDTRLMGTGCINTNPDAGVPFDAGVEPQDAGTPTDAGTEADAGTESDAGTQSDAGVDGGLDERPVVGVDSGVPGKTDTLAKIRPGCGCTSAGPLELLSMFGVALLALRRRRFGR